MKDVKSISPDGKVKLEGGDEMQLVVSNSGQLGVRRITQQDQISKMDQVGQDEPEAITPAMQAKILADLGYDE